MHNKKEGKNKPEKLKLSQKKHKLYEVLKPKSSIKKDSNKKYK